jgi:hypothetical protein
LLHTGWTSTASRRYLTIRLGSQSIAPCGALFRHPVGKAAWRDPERLRAKGKTLHVSGWDPELFEERSHMSTLMNLMAAIDKIPGESLIILFLALLGAIIVYEKLSQY